MKAVNFTSHFGRLKPPSRQDDLPANNRSLKTQALQTSIGPTQFGQAFPQLRFVIEKVPS